MPENTTGGDADPARIVKLELTFGKTALRERIRTPGGGLVIAAVSANGRWAYEREGRAWVVIDKTEALAPFFESGLEPARRRTFDIDHPLHTVPREPRPSSWSVV